jgi:hypothetical protein
MSLRFSNDSQSGLVRFVALARLSERLERVALCRNLGSDLIKLLIDCCPLIE